MKKIKKITILVWLLSFLWAFPTTIVGCFVATFLRLRGNKPVKFGPAYYFQIADGYGLSLGPFIIAPKKTDFYLNAHELGHHLQACFKFGPFFAFIVAIPSVIRFWLREQNTYNKKLIFSCVVTCSFYIISFIFNIIGFCSNSVICIIIGAIFLIYGLIIAIWLDKYEVPQYKNDGDPSYDDVWFECDATTRGKNFMYKYFNDEVRRIWG